MSRYIGEEERKRILKWYADRKTTTWIANEVGRTRTTIIRFLRRESVLRPAVRRKYSTSKRDAAVQVYIPGVTTIPDIAEQFGMAVNTLRSFLDDAGVLQRKEKRHAQMCTRARPTYRQRVYGADVVLGSACEVCGAKTQLCIDHDHLSGKVRGTLCNSCNLSAGKLSDDSDVCSRAAQYVRTARLPTEPGADALTAQTYAQRYESGETLTSIAKDLKTTVTTLAKRMRKDGVVIRKPGPVPHRLRLRAGGAARLHRVEWLERCLVLQGSACAICRRHITIDNAHLDHDHLGGHIRGWLCGECNHGIGMVSDDAERLSSLSRYLQRTCIPIPFTRPRIPDIDVDVTAMDDYTLFTPDSLSGAANHRAAQLGKLPRTCGARKCTVVRIDTADARLFYTRFHLQGGPKSIGSTFGLTFNGQLVAAMSFSSAAICRSTGDWLLQRFATYNSVPGAASRLLKAFRKVRPHETVTTFSDPRYSDGGLYLTLGFTQVSKPGISYMYTRNGFTYHKSQKQRRHLRSECDKAGITWNEDTSERVMAKRLGYERVSIPSTLRWELIPSP